ncbi:MAG: 4-(cytidine 5'-diphospho)-2-C-methyl-D-erythritol kinase, partial [Pseudomonadota bacterium]
TLRSSFQITAPAKLNIGLMVTGRRPDGYHDLVSVMVPIDLVDRLYLTLIPEKEIRLLCEGHPVPSGGGNLVYRAVQAFLAGAERQEGVSVTLVKNIPVAAGMGGGSSDAAAALLALNKMYSGILPFDHLKEMALRLGADVPFFLKPAPSLARGVGEILEPLERWPEVWYVIVMPPLQVSTSWVFGNLKLKLTSGVDEYIKKSSSNDPFAIFQHLENDLETVTSVHFPVIGQIKNRLQDAGALCALMSGSGPSVFGVFTSRGRAAEAKKVLSTQGLGDVLMATNWQGAGSS